MLVPIFEVKKYIKNKLICPLKGLNIRSGDKNFYSAYIKTTTPKAG